MTILVAERVSRNFGGIRAIDDLSFALATPLTPSAVARENLEPAHRLFIPGCKRKL